MNVTARPRYRKMCYFRFKKTHELVILSIPDAVVFFPLEQFLIQEFIQCNNFYLFVQRTKI